MQRGWRSTCSALLALNLAACGGANRAANNRTFYDWSLGEGSGAFERKYPRLDWPLESVHTALDNPVESAFLGVSVLDDAVRFSRPRNWRIRSASRRPLEPFIHYVSPNAYSFAIYQRRDPPGDGWPDILGRYEEDVAAVGAKVVGRGVPVATFWGQGRAYTIQRDVDAAQGPLQSHSRELILRSKQRVVLVQIVYQGQNLAAVDRELLRALETMEVR